MEIQIIRSELFNSHVVVEKEESGNLLQLSTMFDKREDAEKWAVNYMEFLTSDPSKVCKVYRLKDGKNILERLFIFLKGVN